MKTDRITWLEEQLKAYITEIAANEMTSVSTRATYMHQAGKFVRWVKAQAEKAGQA